MTLKRAQTDECGREDYRSRFVAFSVGLGNVIQFPWLVHQHGGAAFILAYLVLHLLLGQPLLSLEASLGQYGQVGPARLWGQILPGALGLGAGMLLLSFLVAVSYAVSMAYCLMYLFNSLRAELPWSSCQAGWTDLRCLQPGPNLSWSEEAVCEVDYWGGCTELVGQSAAQQFWQHQVVGAAGQPGVSQQLALYLGLAWLLASVCQTAGPRLASRAAWLTTSLPCLALSCLLASGLTRPGAARGLVLLLAPDWPVLTGAAVWRAALGQLLYSLGVGLGPVVMLGSRLPAGSPPLARRDQQLVCTADLLYSLLATAALGSCLASLPPATQPDNAPELLFSTLPAVLARLPSPQLCSAVVFCCLVLLGLGPLTTLLLCLTTSLAELLPALRPHQARLGCLLAAAGFMLGLPAISWPAGPGNLKLLESAATGPAAAGLVLAELLIVTWGYGMDKLNGDMQALGGLRPGMWQQLCWAGLAPLALLAAVLAGGSPLHSLSLLPLLALPLGFLAAVLLSYYYPRPSSLRQPAPAWIARRQDCLYSGAFTPVPPRLSLLTVDSPARATPYSSCIGTPFKDVNDGRQRSFSDTCPISAERPLKFFS